MPAQYKNDPMYRATRALGFSLPRHSMYCSGSNAIRNDVSQRQSLALAAMRARNPTCRSTDACGVSCERTQIISVLKIRDDSRYCVASPTDK